MALNEVYANGESINYPVNSAVTSGMFVVLGGIVGVAETDATQAADSNYYATLRHIGVFTGTTSEAVAVGDALYLASAATYGTALTKTVGSNEFVGYAIEAKGAVAGNVKVRINN
jgi:predicted RecA/RadA family phage recombinase